MALDRKDENAWEAHYNMTALGGFIEGQTVKIRGERREREERD